MFRNKCFRKATASLLALVFAFAVVLPPGIAKAESKATIYTGGDIVTVSEKLKSAEAIVVKDGEIAQVGSLEEAKKVAGAGADVVDLKGHTLLPGFYDAHSHFLATGNANLTAANLYSPPMGNISSFQDLINALIEWEKKTPADQWVLGTGYDDGQLKEKAHPTADDLDKVSTERPVVITHFSGHNIVVNHKALELAGITKDSKDPEGGEIGRDKNGEPNGQLWEKAASLVNQNRPPLTKDQQLDAIKLAGEIYAKAGMTSVNEGAGGNDAFDLYMEAIEKGLVKHHVNYWFTDWNKAAELYKKYPKGNESVHYAGKDDLMQLTGVKMFQDGSPQLRTAYMTDPYYTLGEYEEGWKAYPRMPREKLIENVISTHQAGINNIYIHGNGDAAIDDVLAAYEAIWNGVKDGSLRQPKDVNLMRHVVIHSQFSREEQYEKMKEIHALPSFLIMHPYFLGDRHWDIYFGAERSARMSATRDAANNGLRFALHCDAPVFVVDNMLMMQTAVERKSFTGRDIFTTEYKKGEKYRSVDQRITPMEALKALTIDAAYHNGEEEVAGSIDVGKRADLVILDKNPLKVPTNTIKDIKVLATIVNGKAIYEAEGAPSVKPTPAPTPTPTPVAPKFVDIDKHWAKNDIEKAVAAKYLVGVSDDRFAPDAKVTRAMVVSVLHRLAGNPEAKKAVPFKDVPAKEWYAKSVQWAYESGVVSGMSKDQFAPMEPVTREQLAAMLANYHEKTGKKLSQSDKALKGFKDNPSKWAERQMNWAVTTGLIGGMSEEVLAPQGEASRAQLAAILNRYAALEA